jgi:hypothetical protein
MRGDAGTVKQAVSRQPGDFMSAIDDVRTVTDLPCVDRSWLALMADGSFKHQQASGEAR